MTSVTDSRLDVDLVITDPAWSTLPLDLTALSTAAVRAAMATTAHEGGEVVVALGDDAWIRDLNARHRDRDTPTNVLAFPTDAH
ncbi:MAG: rRNA maturation RNAse YbeY, partial [Pseudomonadota bacterium]|nr:rRNA maturation RNAse YbeY [Pseudomonadota bacterium]